MAITLGNPNLILKGIVDVTAYDPTSGDIIGYDNVSQESAVASSVNMGEITGGWGNPVLLNVPDTTKITGTLTSQAFSLEQRKLISGGTLSIGASVPVCETITATGTTLTVTNTPVLAVGEPSSDTAYWCYVKAHSNTSFVGSNYSVNPTTKQVVNFTATSGTSYDVMYFITNSSAKILNLPSVFNPSVATLRIKYSVYAAQNNSTSNSTLQGFLYVIVPRAQFTGDAGVNASQTANATTDYGWTALAYGEDGFSCGSACQASAKNLAYYVYVPCTDLAITSLAVPGGGISVAVNGTKTIPLYATYEDGSVGVPDYSKLTFTSGTTSTATVSNGIVTGVATGSSVISIVVTGNTSVSTTCDVTVPA